MSSKTADKIIKATLVITLLHGITKLLGFIQNQLLVSVTGVGLKSDVFYFVYEGIFLLIYFVPEECLGPTFFPVFNEEYKLRDEKKAWLFGSSVFNLQFIFLGIAAIASVIFSPFIIKYLASGFSPEKIELSTWLLKFIIWGVIPCSLGSLTYLILNAYKKFAVPAAGDVSLKVFFILGILLCTGIFGLGLKGLAIGVIMGSCAKLITHLFGLGGKLRLYRLQLDIKSLPFKKMAILTLPLIGGILFAKFREVIDNYALSFLPDGYLTAKKLAWKLAELPRTVGPYALGIGMFPFLCDMAAKNETAELGKVLNKAIKMMFLFFLPLSVLAIVLAYPITMFAYCHGQVSPEECFWIAVCFISFIWALAFYAIEIIMMQGFYSKQDTWVPFKLGIYFSSLYIVLIYISIIQLSIRSVLALVCIGIAFSLSRSLKTIWLISILNKHIPVAPKGTVKFSSKVSIASLIMGISIYLLGNITGIFGKPWEYTGWRFNIGLLIYLSILSIAGVSIFIIICRMMNIEELREVYNWISEKLKRT